MSDSVQIAYRVDSSVLINLGHYYGQDVFPTLWRNLEALVDEGRLFTPGHVRQEVLDKPVADWLDARAGMIRSFDSEQNQCVQEIMAQFPDCVDPNRTTPDADPFVVALGLKFNWWPLELSAGSDVVVVTQERARSSPAKRPKIPDVCQHFGIRCLNFLDLCRAQGWQF